MSIPIIVDNYKALSWVPLSSIIIIGNISQNRWILDNEFSPSCQGKYAAQPLYFRGIRGLLQSQEQLFLPDNKRLYLIG
jgi:hypothetical protein